MKPTNHSRTANVSKKKLSPTILAAKLGVSVRSVQLWRKRKTMPKNPLIRAAYLKAEGVRS